MNIFEGVPRGTSATHNLQTTNQNDFFSTYQHILRRRCHSSFCCRKSLFFSKEKYCKCSLNLIPSSFATAKKFIILMHSSLKPRSNINSASISATERFINDTELNHGDVIQRKRFTDNTGTLLRYRVTYLPTRITALTI